MKKQIMGVLILVVLITGAAAAMPMSSCTPEQAAAILVQPIKADIAAHRAALVAGEITVEEYKVYLTITKVKLDMKIMLVNALIGSELKANEYRAALCGILPWRIR